MKGVRYYSLQTIYDKRGLLVIVHKKPFKQCYYVTFNGINTVRGNHYHKRIKEWFCVVEGITTYKLYNLKTKETISGVLHPRLMLEIDTHIAHTFWNYVPNTILLNFTDKLWTSKDTIPYELIKTE
jgi:dTDP-4-dehydrorhamnose 3,5-epimerase-like enzyme